MFYNFFAVKPGKVAIQLLETAVTSFEIGGLKSAQWSKYTVSEILVDGTMALANSYVVTF